jgi:uncharacterized phage-associated protein
MTSVHNVAAYAIERSGNLSTMKLQKLCYYAQGWHLAWHGVPLFTEEIQAWQMGPVCRELYRYHAGKASVTQWPRGSVDELTPEEKNTLDVVLDFYQPFSGFDLGSRTHSERPWLEAWEDVDPFIRGRAPISIETMKEYFGQLVQKSQAYV